MRNYISILFSFMVLLAACTKDEDAVVLPNGSISFRYPADKDTLEMPVSILKDTTLVIGLQAALSGEVSGADHWISFAVDTTKILGYRAKYGNALVLPATSYLFYRSTTSLSAGNTVSDSAKINIGQQTKLTEYSTYVLPVVIQSVDGQPDGPHTTRVIYLVFKTGKPLFVNKAGWTIHEFSSVNGASVATNILDDNNLTTFWASNIAQTMPQWVTINFNRDVDFLALNYYMPTALRYPTLGGYPTSIRIETSMDGVNWEDKGTYAGNIVNNMQTLETGETTARYLRFTSLASVLYSSAYEAIFISGISLIP
ncbi:MAG: discoidin domain-containing protein [Candidatus Pseudobacter hemicellulosilyticus]|uniref:Discoidin domain-containing protein n=1 Tax=Candidatus Pseudobacter hemicellulosilyticus TaxID=3121375 RepID=A0AAJ5WUE3_9BACT|nr:MAG: discoidin domain-containing protein [Pseudobacter sp.]